MIDIFSYKLGKRASGGGSSGGTGGGGGTGGEEWIGDGKTHLWIAVDADTMTDLPLYYYMGGYGTRTIDWGDGSEPTNCTDGWKNTTHTYESPGEYIITLDNPSGEVNFGFLGDQNYYIMGTASNSYTTVLKKVELGNNVPNIWGYTFQRCSSLSSINLGGITGIGERAFYKCNSLLNIFIPNSVTTLVKQAFFQSDRLKNVVLSEGLTAIGDGAFSGCYALASINIPKSVTSFGAEVFQNCRPLSTISIPEGTTSIGKYTFYSTTLSSIDIPESVMSIGDSAFSQCFNMKYYDFTKHTSVPTLASASAICTPSGCEIRVPAALYDEWIAATNWSTYASKIVAV